MDVVEVIAKAAGFDRRQLRVTPIEAGLTNQNYRLDVGDRTYFFRRPGAATELLAVDRENELYNTRAAAEAGVGPKVLRIDKVTGGMLLEWLPGRTMSNASFRAPGMPARIAEVLRRLHAGPRFRDDFDMFRLSERYLRLVDERSVPIP
ncbi:MAG TPA: choline/ethanolamine kinase family protein, partial [Candidatus Limnocylindrales bacterium]